MEGHRALAEGVIARDKEVDALELKVENQAITVIARHQPVATDLRLIFTVIKPSPIWSGPGITPCTWPKTPSSSPRSLP